MKTNSTFIRSILTLIIGVVTLIGCSSSKDDQKVSDDLKSFKVILEKTDKGIKMQSVEGSAWINLSFTLKNDQPQAVDEYGMANIEDNYSVKDSLLADYLFTVTKTEKEIILEGMKGTTWSNLSFTLAQNQQQAIDQNGMTNLN